MINLNDKIPGAPNFRYKEFIYSMTAIRKGITNVPTKEQWLNIERLAVNVLQPIRNEFGSIRITSGFRSKELNVAIGGSGSSNHCRGEAADIEPLKDGVSLLDIVIFVYEELDFRTVIAEYFPDGWVHIDYRNDQNIKRLKLKDKEHNYAHVTLDYLKDLYRKEEIS